jgi:hypothetical protein
MPNWKIVDSTGQVRVARMVGFSDFGGTDVPYYFRDLTDDSFHVVSGERLKQSHPIYNIQENE